MRPRLKVTTACCHCRRRKTKCDAQQPACTPCLERGDHSCSYSQQSNRSGRRARAAGLVGGEISEPVRRRAAISQETSPMSSQSSRLHRDIGSSAQLAAGERQVPPQDDDRAALGKPQSFLGAAPMHPGHVPPAAANAWPVGEQQGEAEETEESAEVGEATRGTAPDEADQALHDADAITGTIGDPSTRREFFGRSSAGSFLRQMMATIDDRQGHPRAGTTLGNRRGGARPPPSVTQTGSARSSTPANHRDYVLPARKFADALLMAYYDLVWAVFPILDRTVFQSAYDMSWLGVTSAIPETTLYCMMNLIFALGSQFSAEIEPSQRKETGVEFWKRAHKLFHADVTAASIERVQCLLLMGLYLQGTSETNDCWMAVGSAIRMAQSLGLHSCTPSSSRRELEITRRVWHGCVYQDRVLSMTFGRPSMIAKWLQTPDRLPAMIDDEFLDTQRDPSAIRPDGGPAVLAFFRKSLELYDIINDSLIELYLDSKDPKGKELQNIWAVVSLDQRLVDWAHSLPAHLQYGRDIPDEALVFRRQRVVLRTRYLQARMIVFRPILADLYLKQTSTSEDPLELKKGLSYRIVVQCAELCFETAHEMIDTLYSNFDFDTVTGPVPAWWFGVLYVYTAASILLAQRLRPVAAESRPSNAWLQSWGRAAQLLNAYVRVGESAKRCMAALSILLAKVQNATEPEDEDDRLQPTAPTEQPQNLATHLTDEAHQMASVDDVLPMLDFEDIDFDIEDVSWLYAPAVDIMF